MRWMHVLILDVVGQRGSLAIQPHISDHAVRRGIRAGGERSVANDGLGVGVGVVSIGIPDALIHEIAEPALAHVLDVPPR
jgi:hypothetical protein